MPLLRCVKVWLKRLFPMPSKIFLVFCLLFAALSWGECTISTTCGRLFGNESTCISTGWGQYYVEQCIGLENSSRKCVDPLGCFSHPDPSSASNGVFCAGYTLLSCGSTQELDSAYCALNPGAEGCAPSCDSTHWGV